MKATGTIPKVKDVETKKSKVIQGGAAAESVRICKLCNVVCNSDKVFASHLAGEKHIMKVNRCSTVLKYILVCVDVHYIKSYMFRYIFDMYVPDECHWYQDKVQRSGD